ncbi:MAG: hypothetical protein QOF76_5029 [Solirubrobacteraceae bacterium]|jgi:cell wall-associated NlpC family hydrolase|nr:hypothetical protein [Solirubrobacteraceae bacterium]
MRGISLLLTSIAVLSVAPAAASARQTTTTTAGGASTTSPMGTEQTGGAAYGVDPDAAPRVYVTGSVAQRMPNGYAAAPADAPVQVQEAIFAANDIVGKPYVYGGGHAAYTSSTTASGYDCSATVSYALHGGGLLKSPLDSSSFMRWGKAGKGSWITVYTNPGHAYTVIAGLRLDTSAAGEQVSSGSGPRWRSNLREVRGFKRRHPSGF